MGVEGGRKKGLEDQLYAALDPFSRLRIAIIRQAAYDYRMCSNPAKRDHFTANLDEIRNFFRSKWCLELLAGAGDFEPEEMLAALEREQESAGE